MNKTLFFQEGFSSLKQVYSKKITQGLFMFIHTKKQSGFTLIEIIMVLGIGAMLMAMAVPMLDDYMGNIKDQNVTAYQKQVTAAGERYIKNNFAAVTAVATDTVPVKITVPMLVASGYLPAGFQAQNGYSQTSCILALEPTANHIEALVVSEGGVAIPDKRIPVVAASAGSNGGFIPAASPTVATGAYGAWSVPIANYVSQNCSGTPAGAGHLASFIAFDNGNIVSDYLYRSSVPGHPEANTLNTPLIMGSGTQQTLNAACTTANAVGRDANGKLLTCQSGVWKAQGSAYWEDPVTTFASLPTCNAAISGQTRVVTTPTVGTGARAYNCNGVSWTPLAMDDSGNILVPGTATLDKLAGDLEVTVTATENAACSPNGRIAKDSTGLLLSCQSGVWKRQAGTSGANWYLSVNAYGGDSGWIPNTTGRTIFVQAYTDAQQWGCVIDGYASPWGGPIAENVIGQGQNGVPAACFVSFMVPPGTSWRVVSQRSNGAPYFTVWTYGI